MSDRVNAAVQRASLDGTLVIDSLGRIISYNQRFVDLWKVGQPLLAAGIDAPVLEMVADQVVDPAAFKARVLALYEDASETSRENIPLKDGRTFARYSSPVTLDNGTHFGRVWFFRDITDQKRTYDKVLEDASQFQALVAQQIAGIFIIGADGTLNYINPQFSALFGYTPAEVIGSPFVNLLVDADKLAVGKAFREHLLGGPLATLTETSIKTKNGGLMNVAAHASVSSYQGKPALVGIIIDITKEKTARDLLHASEERLRSVVEQAPDAIIVYDVDANRFLSANLSAIRLFECDHQAALDNDPLELFRPEPTEQGALSASFKGHINDALAGAEPLFEQSFRNSLGREVICEVRMARLPSATGRLVRTSLLDITERRNAEIELRRSEERFRSVFNSVNDAIAVIDIETRKFAEANPRACQMFGYSREEVIGLATEVGLAGDPPYAWADAKRLIERALAGEALLVEWQCRARDGHTFWVDLSLRRAHYGGHDVVLATAQDISKRKVANAALAYGDHVSHALARAVARLVSDASVTDAMSAALRIAGEALQVDQMLVLMRGTGAASDVSVAYSWPEGTTGERYMSAPGSTPGLSSLDDWLAPLLAGAPVMADVSSATGAAADFLRARAINSALLMPILLLGRLWGFASLEVRAGARAWTSVEVNALRTLTEVIAAILAREYSGAQLRDSESRFRAVSDTAQDAIIMVDSGALVTYWNPAAERIFGYGSGEALGKSVHGWLAPPRFHEKSSAGMAVFARTGRGDIIGKTLELAAIRKGGVEFPIELSVSSVLLGSEWHAVATIRDITERNAIVEQLEFAARHDGLTGLVNRAVFVEALNVAIEHAHRDGGQFAVLYLDLDHFKDVNDTLGRAVGDLLLQALAGRLSSAVRSTDTVARFGGDEFALIQAVSPEALDAAVLANKLLAAINLPFIIDGNTIRSGASVGIAVFGRDSPSAESLLSHADVALYRAKSDGRGTCRFFTVAMDIEVRNRVTLSAELRNGLAAGEIFLMYQPQVDADTHEIVGVEALARWRHPTRGLVPPSLFIPIAEQSGSIIALGRWVLREACRQMKAWMEEGIAPPMISVNISGRQFTAPLALEKELAATFTEFSLPAQRVELELTESVLMEVSRENNEMLIRLREAGYRIAIDDFGTGFSSLEYLGRFPVDRIKISQSFIAGLSTTPANRVIVRAAIGLAHELSLDVVAEGVETAEQLRLVRSLGCRNIQGYYFSMPMRAQDLAGALRAGKIVPATADQAKAG